ncbi:hypothetical protein JHS3_05900 [Jeongeupia sp. HS-3]|uniref:EAL domain-containing protein n=1 Tax=Jeongeupia sp. HS-3 TaxID=1009682 RepID=UPI0018A5E48C|nr:EAL domain-containing protein [Jeongeupia sp. HS-3]BCL74854.1 hypothetical protein JHS3_05900 [Jeongeupia sp. HS-3]
MTTQASGPCRSAPEAALYSQAILRHAIETKQFEPWFQPQFSIDGRTLLGVEVLARWHHPERGIVAPAHFIDQIENGPHIEAFNALLLGRALIEQVCWADAGHVVPISFNLPGTLLQQPGTADALRSVVEAHAGDPARVTLEITETTRTATLDHYVAGVAALKSAGFRTSLDDFGCGYASVSNLVAAPFDEMKLDRSLVHDALRHPKLMAALRTILDFAREVGICVIAEGVEDQDDLIPLRQFGCERVQGYLYGPPVQANQFSTLVHEHHTSRSRRSFTHTRQPGMRYAHIPSLHDLRRIDGSRTQSALRVFGMNGA